MISKLKNKKKKNCKKVVNLQKGGAGAPHLKKITTKNLKKVIKTSFLRNFTDKYKQIPGNIKQNGTFSNKKYREAYKAHILDYKGLKKIIPKLNKKAINRMNKYDQGKKPEIQDIYKILQSKTNLIHNFVLKPKQPNVFSPEHAKYLPTVLNSRGVDNKTIKKIAYILNPKSLNPKKNLKKTIKKFTSVLI